MKTKKVIVLPYDRAWKSAFEEIKLEIENAIGDLIIGIIIFKVKTYYLPVLAFGLISFGIKLFYSTKEEKNSPKDSAVLIKELEKRVEAVNLWDK